MVSEIRLYIEGGGNQAQSKAQLRRGFSHFLKDLVKEIRDRKTKWHIIASGSRNATFEDFKTGLRSHPQAVCLLLVDSEGPVSGESWPHLQERDNWSQPARTTDEQCHLMVQTMEAWLIADPDGLQRYYGQGFNRGALPHPANIEQIEREQLESFLRAATKRTSKGEYHKIRHGTELLGQVDAARARAVAPHCERLFETIRRLIDLG